MMRKLLLVALVLTLCLVTGLAYADSACGANLTWTLSSSGVLTISGLGDMDDFNYGSAPWKDDRDSITKVIVEEGVTSIGEQAFYWCRKLTSVQLPETVTSIGKEAFQNCNSLISVNIPSGVTSIGKWTFYGCDKLASVTLPNGLVSIEELAFCDCKSLKEITIPASVTFISDDRTFIRCEKLEKITVADRNANYVSVDGILFNKDMTNLLCYPGGKSASSYTVPDSVTSIEDYGFYWNETIQSVTVPGTVKAIGSDAFAGCSKLTNLTLSEGIESIGTTAFFRCSSLTSIHFPSSLISLGDDMFESASKLTSITVADGSPSYVSVDGILFTADMSTLVAYPAGRKQAAYVIPNSVTTIGEYAILYNQNIVSITFPESLIAINHSAFQGCDKLTRVHFPSQLSTIDDGAFSFCDGLTNIIFPASVYVLGYGAFNWCDNLVSVTVMNPATSFDKLGVFDYGNKGLTLTGIAGSTAEAHATEEEFKFIATTFDAPASTNVAESSGDAWICSACGTSLSGGKFCSECGAARPQAQVCSSCGYHIEDGKAMKFCPECGTKFDGQ